MRTRVSIERFDGGWIVQIPPFALQGRERGVYVRRTFKEAVTVMDFYISRLRVTRRAKLLDMCEQGEL